MSSTAVGSMPSPDRQAKRSQLLTDLKYRWPARYRSSWVALALLLVWWCLRRLAALNRPLRSPSSRPWPESWRSRRVGQMLIIMLGAHRPVHLGHHLGGRRHRGPLRDRGLQRSRGALPSALLVSVLLSLVNGFSSPFSASTPSS